MNRDEARQQIKENLDCRDYLKRSKGANMYICPFCGSGEGPHHTGALKYYSETNTWTCHACGKSGDVLDLIQKTEGIDFNAALQEGANLLGIAIDEPKDSRRQAETSRPVNYAAESRTTSGSPQKRQMMDATEGTANYSAYYLECSERLKKDPAAQEYLKRRGIDLYTADSHFIGYDPAADPADAPGALENDNVSKRHPAKRIIIPTTNSHYIARAIDPRTEPQYSKMNPSTRKGAGSPGIFNAADLYKEKGPFFIAEGWADALSIIECGGNAIALNSTNNGKALIKLLQNKPVHCSFIICFDNDKDPQTAAKTNKEAEDLLHELQRMNYKAIRYNLAGEFKDANEFMTREGKDRMKAAIAAAVKESQRDYLTDFLDKIQTDAYKPCETDLTWFDDLLGGGIIQQSLLLLLAAPGVGKTSLCQQLGESMAMHGKPVIYLNFEMSREQMLAKAISCRLARKGIKETTTEILQGYSWTDQDRQAITAEIAAYRKDAFPFIQYNPGTACNDIKDLQNFLTDTGERAKLEGHAAPAVIVDYLQLLTSRDGADLQEIIKEGVLSMKEYARNYDTFVIGVVATNRDSNKSGKITLSSGRDSSNIEYTADYQLSLNFEDIDNGTVKPDDNEAVANLQKQALRKMVIRVLKNRFSLPGRKALIYFDAAHNAFYPQGRTEAEDGATKYRAEHGEGMPVI